MPVERDDMDWREVVYRGVEDQQLDYKAAQDWNELSRAGRAKFARHVMALANTRGGYIVVGVGEDANGNPLLHTGLTEKQARSFDPSMAGQTVNRYADPAVDFDIVRPEVDGKRYAIFVVQRFSDQPHVCCDACDVELQRGVFYIRTTDARSRAAFRASEMHDLIQRALRNQRQALGRLIRGVLYEGRNEMASDAGRAFDQIQRDCQANARDVFGAREWRTQLLFEIWCYPSVYSVNRFPLGEVKEAAANVILPPISHFPFFEGQSGMRVYFANDALRSHAPADMGTGQRRAYWEFQANGGFYYLLETSPANSKELTYPVLARCVACAMSVIGQLYSAIGVEDELLSIQIGVRNTEGARLTGVPDGSDPPPCSQPDVEVVKRRTVGDMVSDPVDHAVRVARELTERFNVPRNRHDDLPEVLAAFLAGRQP
jgi:hypothetical protein